MPLGKVSTFNEKTGYGFLDPEDGAEMVFVHSLAIESAGLGVLEIGQQVEYDLVPGMDGKSAADNIRLVER